jgi:hypothetical protein
MLLMKMARFGPMIIQKSSQEGLMVREAAELIFQDTASDDRKFRIDTSPMYVSIHDLLLGIFSELNMMAQQVLNLSNFTGTISEKYQLIFIQHYEVSQA